MEKQGEKRHVAVPTIAPVTRGVNIFSLYFDGKRWRIQTMLWDEEEAGNLIPAELLAGKK